MVAARLTAFFHTNRHKPERPRHGASRMVTLHPMTNDSLELIAAARRSAEKVWRDGYAYTKAGIMLDDLVAADMRPRTLFEDDSEKRTRLMGALDEINGRFGRWTAVTASQGFKREWKLRSEMRSPSWTTSIAEVPTVRGRDHAQRPSMTAFVRLPASETLQETGLAALKREAYPNDAEQRAARCDWRLTQIDAPMVLRMLRKVEARGAIDTAKRIRQHVSTVFGYAIAEGLCAVDPAASIGKALKPITKKGKQPAVRTIEEAQEILRSMEETTSGPLTKLASRLLALTVVRPGVVRAAKWVEFEGIDWTDPDAAAPNAIWRVPAERMKLDMESKDDEAFEHVVPLPPQAVEVLHAVRRLTSRSVYLFTSIRSSRHPMSENTIGYMYSRNGFSGRHVPHGWRATFSTIMNERAISQRRPDDRAIIDAMLAHKPKGMSGSEMAYNRALHMARRRELTQDWADILIVGLRDASDLIIGRER